MKTDFQVDYEVKKEAKKDLISQIAGVLTALLPVLAITGYSLDWLTEEFITHLTVLLGAVAALAYNVYAIYKNHFSGKGAQDQKKALKKQGLK